MDEEEEKRREEADEMKRRMLEEEQEEKEREEREEEEKNKEEANRKKSISPSNPFYQDMKDILKPQPILQPQQVDNSKDGKRNVHKFDTQHCTHTYFAFCLPRLDCTKVCTSCKIVFPKPADSTKGLF